MGSWATVEYDHHADLSPSQAWCGVDIAQCGCAMTSLANVMALLGIVSTPGEVTDGAALDPGSLNAWLSRDAQLTAGGWISKGYFYGDVVWTDIQALTGRLHAADPSVPRLRYRGSGSGSGSEAEIRTELEGGRPVILEVPRHFIAAIGIEEGTGEILIWDPYYSDRTHLSPYPTAVPSSRLFKPAHDLSAVLVTAPSQVRIRVTDRSGRTAEVTAGGDPRDARQDVVAGIPGSTLDFDEAWRDPSCSERDPDDDIGNWTPHIPAPDPGGYSIDVIDPDGDGTCVTVYAYDRDGNVTLRTICEAGDHSFEVDYDPGGVVEPASLSVEKTVINDDASVTDAFAPDALDAPNAPPEQLALGVHAKPAPASSLTV